MASNGWENYKKRKGLSVERAAAENTESVSGWEQYKRNKARESQARNGALAVNPIKRGTYRSEVTAQFDPDDYKNERLAEEAYRIFAGEEAKTSSPGSVLQMGSGEYAAKPVDRGFVGPLTREYIREEEQEDKAGKLRDLTDYLKQKRDERVEEAAARSFAEELKNSVGPTDINEQVRKGLQVDAGVQEVPAQTSLQKGLAELGLPDFSAPRGQQYQLEADPLTGYTDLAIASRYGIDPETLGRVKRPGLKMGNGEAAKLDPQMIGYDNLKNEPDFAEVLARPRNAEAEASNARELMGQVITNPGGVRKSIETAYMTGEEKNNYYYLSGKYGQEEAEKYYRSIEDKLNQRKGLAMYMNNQNLADWQRTAYEAAMPVLSGLEQTISGVAALGDLLTGDTQGRASSGLQYADMLLGEKLNEESGWKIPFTDTGWKKALHDAVQTNSAQAPQYLLGFAGAPMIGKATLYASAFGNTFNQRRMEGYSVGESIAMATATAAIEGLTEKLGGLAMGSDSTFVRKLLGDKLDDIANPILKALTATGLDAAGEGMEEAIAGVAEPIVEEYILTGKQDERGFIDKLVDGWRSIDWEDVRYQGLLGATSGGMMSGPMNVLQARMETPEVAIRAAAESINNPENRMSQKLNATMIALKSGGIDDKTAATVAEPIVRMISGKKLGQSELELLAMTDGVLDIAQDIAAVKLDKRAKKDAGQQPDGSNKVTKVTIVTGDEPEQESMPVDAEVNRETAIEKAAKLGGERRIHEEIYDMGGGKQNAEAYGMEYERAYNRGRNSMPLTDQVAKTYKTLTQEQVQAAWNAGRAQQEGIDQKKAQRAKSVTGAQGLVDARELEGTKLNANQRAAMRSAGYVAQALGVKVVWHKSQVSAEGKRTSPNGWYDPKDRSVHLDIYAGSNRKSRGVMYRYAAMRTFAHELTHMIEDTSPQLYGELRAMVFDHLEKKGYSVEAMISEKQRAGQSRYTATQELVADACEMMLQDTDALKTEMARNPSLWERVKEAFGKFVNDLRKALEGIRPASKEALALMEEAEGVLRYAEELQKKWDEALLSTVQEAGEDTNTSASEKAEEQESETEAEQTASKAEKTAERSNLVLSKEKADALNKMATGRAGVTVIGDRLPMAQGRKQRAFLQALGRAYNIEFVIHPSIDKGALNGVYISGNKVHLAADNLEAGLMQTGIHETVHMIRAGEGEGYSDLLESVRGALGSDFDWDATVAARAEADGLDFDAAQEEVLAEAVSTIYTNETVMRAFVMKHQSMAKRLVEGLKSFAAKMREIAEKIVGRTGHGEIDAMLKATDEAVQKVADAYERALAEYKERAKAINYEGREPEAKAPRANKSTLSTWAMALRNSAEKTGNREVIERTEAAIAKVQEFVDQAKEDILAWRYLSSGTLNPYAPKGRSEGLGPLRTNVEYIYSFDPDTSCFRADGYIKIRDNIQRELGRKMTARETQNLIQLMTAYGQMIPCRYCYVYGKRYMLDSVYNKKIIEKLGEGGVKTVFKAAESARRQIFEYLDEHYDVNNRYTLDEEMQVREFVLPTKRKKVRGVEKEVMMKPEDFIRDLRRHFKLESRKNLNTFLKGMVGEWLDDVFNGTSHNYDELAEHVEMDTETLDIHATAVAAAQGGVKANKAKKYIPYDHQLDKIADDDIWNIIAHDGIRFQSSTDFRIEYVLDYMQLLAQMATYEKDLVVGATPILAKNGAKTGKYVPGTGRIEHVSGLPGHMYAKSPDAAYILAPSGLHINASVAFNGDRLGQITENTAEGMPMSDVEKLVKKYKNVGGMAMVTNPAQLAHAMKLVREGKLHQIIPFHASGLAHEYYYDMMAWQDYTSVQNESLYTSADYAQLLRDKGDTPAQGAQEIIEQYEKKYGVPEKLYVRNPKTGAYVRKAPHFLPGDSVFEGMDPETGEAKVTVIPGHNNDYDTYMRLCEEWQVHPRFHQVEIPTEDGGTMKAIDDKVGYMALIYESRPGIGKEPVKADFDIDYALEQLSLRAAQQDKYAKGYLEAYEKGIDREDSIRRGRQYEKAQIYDPMGIEKRFFAEGLNGEVRGLITPDVAAMRKGNGIKIDPKKNVQLSEEGMEVYDAYWDKEVVEDAIRYQPREEDQISDRELLATALESVAQNAEERRILTEYKGKIAELDAKQRQADALRENMFRKGISREAMLENQKRYRQLMEEITRADRKLLDLEAAAPMNTILKRERLNIHKRVQETRARSLQEYRERRNATEARAVMRRTIVTQTIRLRNRLESPKGGQYFIKDEMREYVSTLVKAFTPGADDGLFPEIELAQVQAAYKDMFKDNPNLAENYDENVEENLGELARILPGKKMAQMTMEQLRMLRDCMDHTMNLVTYGERVFAEGRRQNVENWADPTIDKAGKDGKYLKQRWVEGVREFLNNGNATPVYFFKRIGGPLERLYKEFEKGEAVYGQDLWEARVVQRNLQKKYNYEKWADQKDDVLKFTTTNGKQLEIDRETALALWATRERERRNPDDNVRHLEQGGFKMLRTDKWVKQGKKGWNFFNQKQEVGTELYRLSDIDNDKIANWLTAEQKGYATEMVRYLSTDIAKKGNAVSKILNGYSIFGEGFYFPYRTSADYRSKNLGAIENAMLKNMGFTKKVRKYAGNPIVIDSFTKVWEEHVNQMAMYHGMAIPQNTFWRVYNYVMPAGKDADGVDHEYESVRAAVKGAYGEGADKYIEQLMIDIYGGVKRTYGDSLGAKLASKFKRNAVTMSMSVVVQQYSSIARAWAVISPKYFASLQGDRFKSAKAEMLRYSATAKIKNMGRFDMNDGRSAVEWLEEKDYTGAGFVNRTKAFFTDAEMRERFYGYLPKLVDEKVWTQIWKAAKRETAEKSGLTGDALCKATAERFDQIIRETQVYDSVLVRSQLMRDKGGWATMVTSFMGEPTLSYNMFMETVRLAKNKEYKKAGAYLTALEAGVVLNAVLKAIVSAYRDKDEDETYWEKFFAHIVGDLTGSVHNTKMGPVSVAIGGLTSPLLPFGNIPYVSDILEVFQGYDVTRNDMNVAADMYNAFTAAFSEEKSAGEKLRAWAKPLSALTAVPVSNIERDFMGILNLFINDKRELQDTTARGIKYAILAELGRKDTESAETERMLDAAIKGDTKTYESLRVHVSEDLGLTDKEITSAMKSRIRERYEEGGIDEKEAAHLLEKYGGLADEKEDKLGAEREVRKWDVKAESGNNTLYGNIWNHIAQWDGPALKKEIKELKKLGVEDGQIRSSVLDHFKEIYLNASKAEKVDLKAHLITALTYMGDTSTKAKERIEKWEKEE